jgi:hypothetical protein
MNPVECFLVALYALVAVGVFFMSIDSRLNGRQVAANALFWPIFGVIHLAIGIIENFKDLNR